MLGCHSLRNASSQNAKWLIERGVISNQSCIRLYENYLTFYNDILFKTTLINENIFIEKQIFLNTWKMTAESINRI